MISILVLYELHVASFLYLDVHSAPSWKMLWLLRVVGVNEHHQDLGKLVADLPGGLGLSGLGWELSRQSVDLVGLVAGNLPDAGKAAGVLWDVHLGRACNRPELRPGQSKGLALVVSQTVARVEVQVNETVARGGGIECLQKGLVGGRCPVGQSGGTRHRRGVVDAVRPGPDA